MSKRGENIYKRRDNRWEARYIQSYRPDGTAKVRLLLRQDVPRGQAKNGGGRAALLTEPAFRSGGGREICKYCDEWLLLKRSCVKGSTYQKIHFGFGKAHQARAGRMSGAEPVLGAGRASSGTSCSAGKNCRRKPFGTSSRFCTPFCGIRRSNVPKSPRGWTSFTRKASKKGDARAFARASRTGLCNICCRIWTSANSACCFPC